MIQRNTAIAVAKAVALMLVASSAHANLITNGNFEQYQYGAKSARLTNTDMTGWKTTSGWSFVVPPGKAGLGFAELAYGYQGISTKFQLWNDGGDGNIANGGASPITQSPAGGNFIVSDGDYQEGSIYQSVSGLKVGQSYDLTFYAGLAQQKGAYAANHGSWNVKLGNSATQVVSFQNISTGFTGWTQEKMTFTANAATATLSFLASGGPNGAPPFLALDGVSLDVHTVAPTPAVPEPEEWAMMLVGAGLVSFQIRRKQVNVTA